MGLLPVHARREALGEAEVLSWHKPQMVIEMSVAIRDEREGHLSASIQNKAGMSDEHRSDWKSARATCPMELEAQFLGRGNN